MSDTLLGVLLAVVALAFIGLWVYEHVWRHYHVADRLPPFMRACRCRSYYRRTGRHAVDCPRR